MQVSVAAALPEMEPNTALARTDAAERLPTRTRRDAREF